MARTTPAVFSGRMATCRPPLSMKSYISLWTMSLLSPTLRLNTSISSRIGVRISA
jgi:hypothetical protein